MNYLRLHGIIRRATAEDASLVVELINGVCSEGLYMSTPHYIPTPEWEMVLRTPYNCHQHLLLVSEIDSQIVGWCRVFSDQTGQGDIGLGLLKPYREQGIGTAIMERVIVWAQGQQLAKLTADTFLTNRRAVNLFEKVGFTIAGRRQVKGYYGDKVMLRMEREL